MEGGGDRRRAPRVREVGLANDIDVLGSFENGHGLDYESESVTVGLGSGEVKVEEVDVPGVIGGQEETVDPTQISCRSGDEVGDGRRGGFRGGVGVGEEDVVGLVGWEEERVGSGLGGRGRGGGGGGGGGGEGEEEEEGEEGNG